MGPAAEEAAEEAGGTEDRTVKSKTSRNRRFFIDFILKAGYNEDIGDSNMKEHEITYFGVYHDGDVDHGMVDHLIKAVNAGRQFQHDVCALIEQRSHITPNVLNWAFMNHIDMVPDDSHYMGLTFKHCTAWGEDQTEGEAISVGHPDDLETYLCVASLENILFGSGDKTQFFTRSVFSLPETRMYLGEMAKARMDDYQREYGVLMESVDKPEILDYSRHADFGATFEEARDFTAALKQLKCEGSHKSIIITSVLTEVGADGKDYCCIQAAYDGFPNEGEPCPISTRYSKANFKSSGQAACAFREAFEDFWSDWNFAVSFEPYRSMHGKDAYFESILAIDEVISSKNFPFST